MSLLFRCSNHLCLNSPNFGTTKQLGEKGLGKIRKPEVLQWSMAKLQSSSEHMEKCYPWLLGEAPAMFVSKKALKSLLINCMNVHISVWSGVQWSVETAPDLHCLLLWSSYWIIPHRSTLRQVLKIPMEENRCWILLLIFQVTALTNIIFLFVCFHDFSL